ncbi:hypothetical protein RUND412_004659 [Rhizina undulata]
MNPLARTSSQETPAGSPTSTRKGSVYSLPKPPTFAKRNGRRYHGDESIPYFLPCDAQELSRQSLLHELQREVYGGYHCAEFSDDKIPNKVLEYGCGTAVWSASVADEFAARGRPDVQFVGLDMVPVHGDMSGVNFTFVQHNFLMRLPFADGEFDYIFMREVAMGSTNGMTFSDNMQECVRCLKAGGTLEIQCSDYSIRSLQRTATAYVPGSSAYAITPTTQFAQSPENSFIDEWNNRITKMLSKQQLSAIPCTLMGPQLLMEDEIVGVHSKRMALPLDEVWWESSDAPDSASTYQRRRVSSDSNSISSNRSGKSKASSTTCSSHRRCSTGAASSLVSPLTEEEKAARHLGKLTFTQMIDSLEPALREANAIDLDEWDRWYKEMMINFFEKGGLRGGECIEFGAWWGTKAEKST